MYNLTTLCLNGTLSCFDLVDVIMGDIPKEEPNTAVKFWKRQANLRAKPHKAYLLYISISGVQISLEGRRILLTPPYSVSFHVIL